MNKIPTYEQIRKWAEDEKKGLIKEFSEQSVRQEVNKLFKTQVLQEVLARVLGLECSKWDGYKVPHDFDKESQIYKEIKEKTDPIIVDILKDACKDYQFSKKDLQQIKSAYRNGFIESCKETAKDLGREDGLKKVREILGDVMEEENEDDI